MSCVIVLTPVLASMAWPVLVAMVTASLAQAGYSVIETKPDENTAISQLAVDVEVERSDALAASLNRDQTLTLANGEVTVTLQKDARGRCVLHTEGRGKTKAELAEIGRALMQQITQAYVREKLLAGLTDKGYQVVSEQQEEDRSIHLTVRRWR